MISRFFFIALTALAIFSGMTATAQDNDGLTQEQKDAVMAKELEHMKNQALKAMRRGEYPYAERMFQQYIEYDNDDFKIHEYLGQLYMYQKKYDEALPVLQRAVELNPSYVAGHVNLGKIYRDFGYKDLSIQEFTEALKLYKDIDIVFQMGLTYERFNELDKAEELYENVIAVKPTHAEAHFSIGLLHLRRGEFEQAAKKIERALQLEPGNPIYATYLEKAQALLPAQEPTLPADND